MVLSACAASSKARPLQKARGDTFVHLGYNRPRFSTEGSNPMRSRSSSALGARNQIAAVLLVVAGAFGLTSLPPPARADEATEQARKHYRRASSTSTLANGMLLLLSSRKPCTPMRTFSSTWPRPIAPSLPAEPAPHPKSAEPSSPTSAPPSAPSTNLS